MSNQNVPELRVDGFEGAWVTGPLANFLEISTIANGDLKYNREDVYAVSLNEGIVNQIKFHGRSFAGKNLDNYDVVLHGDVVYTKSPLSATPFGIVKSNGSEPGIVSPLYAVYHPKPGVWSHFVQNYFALHGRLNDYFRPLVNKGAKNTMNISDKDALKGEVTFPSSLEEQRAIGEIFTNLDTAITSHKKKLGLLKQTKMSLLQRMFPQDGATVPDLRVDGFEGEWRRTRLGDEGRPHSGSSFPLHDQGQATGIPFFKVSDMALAGNEREMISSRNLVSESQISANGWKPIVEVPSIVFPKRGAAILTNRKRMATIPFLIDNNVMAYIFDAKSVDPNFLLALFDTIDLGEFVQIGSLPAFDNPQVERYEIRFPPTLEEQRVIGEIFAKLDTLITAQTQLIDKLNQTKSALLQKMFV